MCRVYIYIHTHKYAGVYIHFFIHVAMYVCVYICIHIYVSGPKGPEYQDMLAYMVSIVGTVIPILGKYAVF